MAKSKHVRIVALLLAVLTVFSMGGVVSLADETESNVPGSSGVGNLTDIISASSYEQYLIKHSDAKKGTKLIPLDVLKYSDELTDAKDVKVYPNGSEGPYKGGKPAIYLPEEGTVGWKIEIPEGAGGLYTFKVLYYFDATTGKKTSIERSLYIDGEIPYYESTYLSFTKTYVADYLTKDDVAANSEAGKGGTQKFEHESPNGDVFLPDLNGNEIRPDSNLQSEWRTTYFSDVTGYYTAPLEYYLSEGTHEISLYAQREAMYVAAIELVPYEEEMSYSEYLAKWEAEGAKDVILEEPLRYEAEFVGSTSESTIYATNDRSSSITSPQHPALQALNTLGGGTDDKRWNIVGQWIRYSIEVPEDGFYKIAFRFNQNTLQGSFVSRKIRIQLPGEEYPTTPFYEASFSQFRYEDDWQVEYLNDGTQEFKFYLKKGVNILEFEANLGGMSEIIRRVDDALDKINEAYIKILMIAGNNPDENTDYGFYRRIPEAVDALYNQSVELNNVIKDLKALSNNVGSRITTLETVADLIEKMGKNEEEIAKNLSSLKSNLGTLGTWINDSRKTPLELDYFELHSGNATEDDKPRAIASFWSTLGFEFRMFIASFTNNYDTLGQLSATDSSSIEVWVSTARDQTQIIRNLVNNEFTPDYNISVELKLVAGGSLLPSVLAGVGPDVSVGHGSGDVINWAIRSALVEITDYVENDPDNIYDWFSESAWLPLELDEVITIEDYNEIEDKAEKDKYMQYVMMSKAEYDALDAESDKKKEISENKDGYYTVTDAGVIDSRYMRKYSMWGVPAEQTFYMMFYRADIFQQLGIEPPETWQDFDAVIGKLLSNHMEVAMPTSLEGLKLFLYQMGGDLYSNGGQTINIDSNVAISAFETLCTYFQQYRFPISYAFSSRFRTGELPIGIVPYTSYTELSVYATEIKGLWEFVPLPGIPEFDADGNITSVNNTSISGTSALIMLVDAEDKDANGNKTSEDKTDESWQFMKWFVSEETQTYYASELTAVLGTVSKHPTANIEALKSLPWTTSEMNNLNDQFQNLSAVREYPGGYIIGRYVNFSFLDVYNNNADPVDALLEYVIDINSELERKRQEFGLATLGLYGK